MATSRIGQDVQRGSAPAGMSMSFNDFGELARAFLGPDVRATQLDRGPFEGSLAAISVGPVRVAHVRSSRAGTVAGMVSPGYRTFDLPMMSHTEADRRVARQAWWVTGEVSGRVRRSRSEVLEPRF